MLHFFCKLIAHYQDFTYIDFIRLVFSYFRSLMKELRDSEHTVFCSEFTPDSRNLITTDANGDLRLWDVFSNHSKPVATLEEAHDLG